jgi:hypothetical protein
MLNWLQFSLPSSSAFDRDSHGRDNRSHRTLRLTERYFIDKFPIYVSEGKDSVPVVTFCYIDGGQIATPGFETYLDQYARLFAVLGRFRIIYVTTSERNILAGAKAFNSCFGRVIQKNAQPLQPAASRFGPEFAGYRLEHNYEFLETPTNIWACGKSSNQQRSKTLYFSRQPTSVITGDLKGLCYKTQM